jgi:hypothetical protein
MNGKMRCELTPRNIQNPHLFLTYQRLGERFPRSQVEQRHFHAAACHRFFFYDFLKESPPIIVSFHDRHVETVRYTFAYSRVQRLLQPHGGILGAPPMRRDPTSFHFGLRLQYWLLSMNRSFQSPFSRLNESSLSQNRIDAEAY